MFKEVEISTRFLFWLPGEKLSFQGVTIFVHLSDSFLFLKLHSIGSCGALGLLQRLLGEMQRAGGCVWEREETRAETEKQEQTKRYQANHSSSQSLKQKEHAPSLMAVDSRWMRISVTEKAPLKPSSSTEFMIPTPVPLQIEEYHKRRGLKWSRTLRCPLAYKSLYMSRVSCL